MSKALFVMTLGVSVTFSVIVLGRVSLPDGWWVGLIAAFLGSWWAWGRYLYAQAQEHEFRRAYEASPEAAFSALCGVLASLDYRITSRDPVAGSLTFSGGRLGPWIGRFGVDCSASVRAIADHESEIVINGRVNLGEQDESGGHIRHGAVYEGGMDARVDKIFDLVGSTVVTYAMIEAS